MPSKGASRAYNAMFTCAGGRVTNFHQTAEQNHNSCCGVRTLIDNSTPDGSSDLEFKARPCVRNEHQIITLGTVG